MAIYSPLGAMLPKVLWERKRSVDFFYRKYKYIGTKLIVAIFAIKLIRILVPPRTEVHLFLFYKCVSK